MIAIVFPQRKNQRTAKEVNDHYGTMPLERPHDPAGVLCDNVDKIVQRFEYAAGTGCCTR